MIIQSVEPVVTIGNAGYHTTDINIKNTKYNEIDTATLTVLPFSTQNEPDEGDRMYIRESGEPMFEGFVADIKDKGGHLYEITAFNNIHNLKVNNININVSDYMPVSKLLQNHVFPQADVFNFDINLAPSLGLMRGSKNSIPIDNRVTMDRNNTPAAQVVDELAKLANAVWWVNNENMLVFGSPLSELHQLEHIVDTSVGKTTPPYRSVKVVGDNVVSREGWEGRNMLSKEPTTAVCSIDTGETINWKIRTGTLKKPTFTYKSKDIKTQKQADAIAQHVAEKLVQQTKSGWVECTGRPGIEVYDVIEMPYRFGGEKYLVSGVEQIMNNNNGFTTKIHCGGLISVT